MSISNISSMLAEFQYGTSWGIGQAQKAVTSRASFAQQLQSTTNTAGDVEIYTKYLEAKYGGNIIVQNVDNTQKSIDTLGSGTFGTGNVVIAPNILGQMANDPEKAAYYEGKIQHYFDSVPRYQAELSAMGHEIHSSGIVIHPDGTVTHYICGDLKPEVRAKIEAQVKAEQEEKAERKRQYQELSAVAAEKRRLSMEQYHLKPLQNRIIDVDNIYIVGKSQVITSAAVDYTFLNYSKWMIRDKSTS